MAGDALAAGMILQLGGGYRIQSGAWDNFEGTQSLPGIRCVKAMDFGGMRDSSGSFDWVCRKGATNFAQDDGFAAARGRMRRPAVLGWMRRDGTREELR